jgi:hypothetical protein
VADAIARGSTSFSHLPVVAGVVRLDAVQLRMTAVVSVNFETNVISEDPFRGRCVPLLSHGCSLGTTLYEVSLLCSRSA